MNFKSLYKSDPERLYKDDVGLFFKHFREDKQLAWDYLYEKLGKASDANYAILVPQENKRERFVFNAVKSFAAELDQGALNGYSFKLFADFERFFDGRYLRDQCHEYYYAAHLQEFYEALLDRNDTAWRVFDRMVYPKVKRRSIFRNIKDAAEEAEVYQDAIATLALKIFRGQITPEKAEESVGRFMGYFLNIAKGKAADYFRRLSRFDPNGLDILDRETYNELSGESDFTTHEGIVQDEDAKRPPIEFEWKPDEDVSEGASEDDELYNGGFGPLDIHPDEEWIMKALGGCMDKLHQADIDKARQMGREIHHWRRIVEMKFIHGLSHKEIGEQLGISEGNSQNRLAIAMYFLKQCMISKGINHLEP